MECSNCRTDLAELRTQTADDRQIVCPKCQNCHKCSLKSKELCQRCSIQCRRCDKRVLKYAWPHYVHRNGRCDKCSHICHKCDRYVVDRRGINHNHRRWCEKCFIRYKSPDDHGEEKKYVPVFKKKMTTARPFLRWRVDEYKNRCQLCNTTKWCHKLDKEFTCRSCQPTSRKGFIQKNPNPSSGDKRYILDKSNQRFKWVLDANGTSCHGCYTRLWIPSSVYVSTHHYRCSRCRPVKKNTKWKFVKRLSRWVVWSEKKNCQKCDRSVWLSGNLCTRCQKKTKKLIQ